MQNYTYLVTIIQCINRDQIFRIKSSTSWETKLEPNIFFFYILDKFIQIYVSQKWQEVMLHSVYSISSLK